MLVLGATSIVGQYLVQRLATSHCEVVAVSRESHEDRPHVTWIAADLAGGHLELPQGIETTFSVSHIWLLPGVIDALAGAGVKRLVAFSSTSRYTKEDSPNRYERIVSMRLVEAEDAVQRQCTLRGIDWTILRPTIIYAEGRDRSITRLAAFIKRFGVLPLSGNGTGLRQPVHADDLAAGGLEAAKSAAARNRAYNVPGGETISYRTMCERIFEGLGRKPRIVSVPPIVWWAGFAVAGRFLRGTTSAMGQRMSEDLVFDSGPAERDFGWRPRGFRPAFEHG